MKVFTNKNILWLTVGFLIIVFSIMFASAHGWLVNSRAKVDEELRKARACAINGDINIFSQLKIAKKRARMIDRDISAQVELITLLYRKNAIVLQLEIAEKELEKQGWDLGLVDEALSSAKIKICILEELDRMNMTLETQKLEQLRQKITEKLEKN